MDLRNSVFRNKVFHREDGPFRWANARMVRYADDFVVLARYVGSRLIGYIETKLEGWMGLSINRRKTRVLNLRRKGESVDFLGFTYRYDRDVHGRATVYLNVQPSRKALYRLREEIRKMTSCRKCFKPVTAIIGEMNRYLSGWSSYYRFGHPRKALREVNRYVREKLTRHVQRRSQLPMRPPRGVSYYKHLGNVGVVYLSSDGVTHCVCLLMKSMGKPYAGNPHVRFDEGRG